MAVAAGQAFGNFQVVRLLGEGGFGEVYEAENPFLQRRAAIKIMHTGMDQDPELVRRFLNEARAASAIRHPNIIDVFDAGVTGEGEPYILMEFLEGDSLQKVIAQQERLPLETVQEVARQAGSALAAAHSAGIVHRDLKPENLFLIPDSAMPMGFRVKVLDFGIAKIKRGDDKGSTLKTQAGLLMGSPAYMSPEQCRDSSDVDLRSDIYSLGIIVYEMLAGVPPFVSDSATEMLVMQITAEPPPVRQYVPDLPDHVEETLLRALAKDREKRFGSVDYFVGALQGNYPALTAHGNANTPGLTLDGMPRRSLYAREGFGYEKTPGPLGLGGLGGRSNRTPVPTVLPNKTVTTLSHATGETSTVPDVSSDTLDTVNARRWPLFVVVAGVVAAAGLFFWVRGGNRTSDPAPAPVAAPPALAPAPAPTVRLQVRSSPPGATVAETVGGKVLGVTPLEHAYPHGDGKMELVLRLEGYKDETIAVGLDHNSAISIELARAEPPAAVPAVSPAGKNPGRVRKSSRPTKKEQFKEEEWLVH
jgi:serine/threonine protein kinase